MDPPAEGEYVSYQFYIDKSLWDEWKNSVDRDTPLHDRLTELLRADIRADGEQIERALAEVPDIDNDETLNLLRLKLGRCNARAKTAADALQDDNPEKALVTIDKVTEISQPFARET